MTVTEHKLKYKEHCEYFTSPEDQAARRRGKAGGDDVVRQDKPDGCSLATAGLAKGMFYIKPSSMMPVSIRRTCTLAAQANKRTTLSIALCHSSELFH